MTTVLVNHVEQARIEHDRPKLERLPLPDPFHGTAGFYLGPGAKPALHAKRPSVLLDDVMTTGSTLAAACLALKAKPIQSISLVVLMRR